MNAQAIVDQFFIDSQTYQRDAMQAAADQWAEVGPLLIARTIAEAEALSASENAEVRHLGCAYALELFGHLRDPAAGPAVLALCRLPDEVADTHIADTACEDLGQILYRTCAARFRDVLELFGSPQVNEWVRGAALKAMQYATAEGLLPRGDLLEAMLAYLEGLAEDEESELELTDTVGFELLSMRPHEFAERVRALVDAERVPEYDFDEDVEELLRDDPAIAADWIVRTKEDLAGYEPEDLHRRMSWWACFEPSSDRKGAEVAVATHPATNGRKSKASPKVKQRKHKKQIAKKAKKANRKRK